jgi:hypothetical protein
MDTILLQAKDRILQRLTFKKDSLEMYFAFKILSARLLGLFKSLHPYLARSALLKHLSSRKPIPPLVFEKPNFFQLIQRILEPLSL